MIVIIVTVVVRGPAVPVELKGDPALRFTIINPVNIVRSIAVISFAFVCHHNSLRESMQTLLFRYALGL